MESSGLSAQSPFAIPLEDVDGLNASPTFQVLRSYLANQANFCTDHDHCADDVKETWLLHRDILHALTMPVAALFKRASALAGAALCTQKSEDLEMAFAGEARGAYLWLQCFMSEEEDWIVTRGCPACVTLETLRTESHLRFTIAASLLSTASVSSPNSSPAASTTSTPVSEDGPSESGSTTGRTLPPLPHILPALREALGKDEFWGPDSWTYVFSRATQLSAGIQALIGECVDLESLVSSPTTTKPASKRSVTVPGLMSTASTRSDDLEQGMRIKKGKMAKRQLRMKGEEIEIMQRCAMQCWARAAVPSKVRNELLGRGERRRSLTCP